jgi:hypothetical protein
MVRNNAIMTIAVVPSEPFEIVMQVSPEMNSVGEARTAEPRTGGSSASASASVAEPVALSFWSCAPLCILALGSLLVTAFVTLRPHDPRRLAAVFPPWWSAAQSLTAASQVAAVTGLGAFPFIVAVSGNRSGLEEELRKAGALVVVDGAFFTYCGNLQKGV